MQGHIEDLRELLNRHVHAVREAVQALLASKRSGPYARVASRFFLLALDNVEALFDPNRELPEELEPHILLHTPLLRIPTLALDDENEPMATAEELGRVILESLETGVPDYRDAFKNQLDLQDHLASHQLLKVLREQELVDDEEWDDLRQRREKAVYLQDKELRGLFDATRRHLERNVAFGLVSETDRARYAGRFEILEQKFKQEAQDPFLIRFFEYRRALEGIDRELEGYLKRRVEAVRPRLDALPIGKDDPRYERIMQLLNDGDPATANDYIDMVERGEELPATSSMSAFEEFFSSTIYSALESGLESRNGNALLKEFSQGKNILGLPLTGVPGAQRDSALSMLQAWYKAKNRKSTAPAHLIEAILTGIGFNVTEISDPDHRQKRVTKYKVRTQPLRDRLLCPLPSYGSKVDGRYTIVCVWDRPSEDELLSIAGENDFTRGVIVFYFGRLTEKRRRDLAARCQEEHRTFLVLDEMLIYWLCAQRSTRLPTFFECAFPFTFAEPFVTTASLVPPEMFYGRKRERQRIEDPYGTCFIYGGRQLGKTALLCHVVRERHDPDRGQIFEWIDLKAKGLGLTQKVDRIGSIIADALKPYGVLAKNLGSHTLTETIYEHIANWLDEDDERRILLLLDEADRFLEIDGDVNFEHCVALKSLMERTQRRFKVVFAGLHNVQRTTRQGNNPLAHLGEPICIGPLSEDGEWREALQLIKKPFETMGFKFESDDLPFRILSQTNFYPSLLQIYGKELLRYLHQHFGMLFDANECPPYIIKSSHLQEAYQSQSLRANIRQKFKLTLQLDQRYEVIAYALAYQIRHENPELLIEGLSVSKIRELALAWWEEGFKGIDSGHDVRVLLEEMVGLGVLREVADSRYTLRNSNIVLLLGTDEEIFDELGRERELPVEYKPASFRNLVVADGEHDFRRSPLTAAQEASLHRSAHGVLTVFGTHGAGYADFGARLQQIGGDRFVALNEARDRASFMRSVDEVRKGRKGEGLWVFHVSSSMPWDRSWLEAAVEATRRLQSHRSFVRIVFSADATKVWHICDQISDETDLLEGLGVEELVTLEPWRPAALQRWLQDVEMVGSNANFRDELGKVTGNWPELLYDFYRYTRLKPGHDWSERLKAFKENRGQEPQLKRSLELFRLPDAALPWLYKIVERGRSFTVEDLLREPDVAIEEVQKLVRWGRWLRLISMAQHHDSSAPAFELEPTLHSLLEWCLLHDAL